MITLEKILGSLKVKENLYRSGRNFTVVENEVNSIRAEVHQPNYTPALTRQESVFSVGTGYDSLGVLQDLKSSIIKGQVPINAKGLSAVNLVKNGNFANGTTGWSNGNTTTPTVVNNEIMFTATSDGGGVYQHIKHVVGHRYFYRCWVKASSNSVKLRMDGFSEVAHSGSGKYELLSFVSTYTIEFTTGMYIQDMGMVHSPISFKYCKAIDMGIDTSNPDYNLTADQMNKKYPNWFDGIGSVNNARIKSVGKNSFNKDSVTFGKRIGGSGETIVDVLSCYSDYININSIKKYSFQKQGAWINWYDSTKAWISSSYASDVLLYENATPPINANYVIFSPAIANLATAQFEEGTIATTYETYQESISYLPDMHSLLNGVVDEIVDGKSINRIVPYELKATDITSLQTSFTNFDSVFIASPATKLIGISITIYSTLTIDGFAGKTGSYVDSLSILHYFYIDSNNLVLTFPKGTYATLAAAQTALAGTKIIYELATPIVEDVVTPLTVFPNGTISVDSDEETTIPELTFEYPLDIASVIARLNEAVNQNAKLINDKADKKQEDAIKATLKNGWLHNGIGLYYFKDTIGFVHVFGEITGGTMADGTDIMCFPPGYCLKHNFIRVPIISVGSENPDSVVIYSEGQMKTFNIEQNATIGINCSFYAGL